MLLGEVLREQAGDELFARVEKLRLDVEKNEVFDCLRGEYAVKWIFTFSGECACECTVSNGNGQLGIIRLAYVLFKVARNLRVELADACFGSDPPSRDCGNKENMAVIGEQGTGCLRQVTRIPERSK